MDIFHYNANVWVLLVISVRRRVKKITVCPPFNASMPLTAAKKTKYNCEKRNLRDKKIKVILTLIMPVMLFNGV